MVNAAIQAMAPAANNPLAQILQNEAAARNSASSGSSGITNLPAASNTNASVSNAVSTPGSTASLASQLANAYNSGDYGTVNDIIANNQLTSSAIGNMFPGFNTSSVNPAVSYFNPASAPSNAYVDYGGD